MRLIGHLSACLLLAGWAAPGLAEPSKEEDAEQAAADGEAVLEYVKANELGETWHGQPTRLDTEEIRKAYPGYRVYHTFAAPPVRRFGGAAPSPQEVERDRKAEAEYQKQSLRMAFLVKDGKPTALTDAADYNTGLMPIKSDDDAKIAAAAILSLRPIRQFAVPPARVETGAVKISKTEKGWTGTTVVKHDMQFRGSWSGAGTVAIDADGKVTAVAHSLTHAPYKGPLPPSAPPRSK